MSTETQLVTMLKNGGFILFKPHQGTDVWQKCCPVYENIDAAEPCEHICGMMYTDLVEDAPYINLLEMYVDTERCCGWVLIHDSQKSVYESHKTVPDSLRLTDAILMSKELAANRNKPELYEIIGQRDGIWYSVSIRSIDSMIEALQDDLFDRIQLNYECQTYRIRVRKADCLNFPMYPTQFRIAHGLV